jgi:DNA replication protein DnaC
MSALQKMKSVGCSPKIEVCEKHGEYESKPFTSFNRTFYTLCPMCDEERRIEDERKKKEEKEQRYYAILSCAGVQKRFINCKFDDYQPATSKAVKIFNAVKSYHDQFEKMKKVGTSLIMCGRPGTGKTHLANAMVISLINQRFSVAYTTSFQMMARIKATYSKYDARETESAVISDLINKDLLVIDEVGVQFGSETEKVLFYQIINGRYDNVLPTILISNLTPKELEKFVGERCFDRLKEGAGAVLSFDWDSYRK